MQLVSLPVHPVAAESHSLPHSLSHSTKCFSSPAMTKNNRAGPEFTCNVGDLGSICGLGRSPGEGNGYPLQYSGLENSMDCIVSPWGRKESDMTERLSLTNWGYRGDIYTWTLPPRGTQCREDREHHQSAVIPFVLTNQCKEIEENNRMGKTRDLFKKIRDTKGTFHTRMGSIKDRNGMDLTEAENIKKRWQEYTEELYKRSS